MGAERARQLVEAGLSLRLSGDLDEAKRLFEQALKLDPANAKALEYLQPGRRAESGRGAPPGTAASAKASNNPFVRKDSVPLPPGSTRPASGARGAAATRAGAADEVATLLRGVEDLLELDDHTGAMDLLVKAQELAPHDSKVRLMREKSERTLTAMLESKLGDLRRVPRVKLQGDEIIWLNLDHRAGFVLAQIDGAVSCDDLFALSGMSRLDTARILVQLLEDGVISIP